MGRSPSLLQLLRNTLARVRNTAELPQSTPHRLELERNLLTAIAELEENEAEDCDDPHTCGDANFCIQPKP